MWLVPEDPQKIVMAELLISESREGWVSKNSHLTPEEWKKRLGRLVVIVPMFWFLGRGEFISMYVILADPS